MLTPEIAEADESNAEQKLASILPSGYNLMPLWRGAHFDSVK